MEQSLKDRKIPVLRVYTGTLVRLQKYQGKIKGIPFLKIVNKQSTHTGTTQ
jgi:hypothetical protein